jgi:hypothetical protein
LALHTIGTTTTTALNCLAGWSEALLDADIKAIAQAITDDSRIAARKGTPYVPAPSGILATATTHGSTTLDTLVSTGGGPLGSIQVGMLVFSIGIGPGTYVAAIPTSTSVTLSQAATGSSAGINVTFVPANRPGIQRSAQLLVPSRGILNVLPGDVVAVDPTTGWPILVSGAAISAAGSLWHFV